MKKLLYMAALMLTSAGVTACSETDAYDVWEDYSEWRAENDTWLVEQEALLDEDGKPFYSRLSPVWAPNEYVLIHWFNDRTETEGNLSPMLTSWTTTKYNLYLCDDTRVDTSENQEKGEFTAQLSTMISGWKIALMNMHVGDTVQLVVPYASAYGISSTPSIPPFSVLRFNVRLADIPAYEIRP